MYVPCHTSTLRSPYIRQMILSITIGAWLIKRNDMSCIQRKKKGDSDNHSAQKKKKNVAPRSSPPAVLVQRNLFKTSHNSLNSFSSIQICSFSLAQYSIQCFLCYVSVPGLALCLWSVAVILYRTLLLFPVSQTLSSLQFSIFTAIDKKKKGLQINKAAQRQNRQVQGRPEDLINHVSIMTRMSSHWLHQEDSVAGYCKYC